LSVAESLIPLADTGMKVDVEVQVRMEADDAGPEDGVAIGNKNSAA
jgi:hypothetical protein